MQPRYKHTQAGTFMLFLLIVPIAIILFVILLIEQTTPPLPVILVFLALMIPAYLFRSLSVEVNEERVLVSFGPGYPRRAIPLGRIQRVQVVRNAAWMGLGIHAIPGGWIYNISGLDGVEVTLQDGSRVRIGSDEPDALAQAVESARMHPPSLRNS